MVLELHLPPPQGRAGDSSAIRVQQAHLQLGLHLEDFWADSDQQLKQQLRSHRQETCSPVWGLQQPPQPAEPLRHNNRVVSLADLAQGLRQNPQVEVLCLVKRLHPHRNLRLSPCLEAWALLPLLVSCKFLLPFTMPVSSGY